MKERRVHARYPVSWPARLWIGDDVFAEVRAIEVSRGGARVSVSRRVAALVKVSMWFRLEVFPDPARPIFCVGEVRHRTAGSVGLPVAPSASTPSSWWSGRRLPPLIRRSGRCRAPPA